MLNTLSVYKISFKKTSASYAAISDLDQDRIANLYIESSFNYEKDDLFYCYVLTTEIEIRKYKKILTSNGITHTFGNVSDKIIKNEYDISFIKDYLDDENFFIYEIFLEDLEKWIYNRLDIDIILDIISTKGIDSLRAVDKQFLKDKYES
jgi:hypothetical protein